MMNKPKGHVLIVDDNLNNIEILMFALTEYGYQIQTARSGQEALRNATQQPPDLILLDVMLPDMDGYTTCQALKQLDLLKDVPVVFISSLHETLDKLKAFRVGGVDYLTKPLEFEEVIARADAHIMLYRQRQEIERLLLEREKVEQAEHEQRLLVDALLKIATVMNSTLDLQEVLHHILDNVGQVVEHDTAIVITLDQDWGQIADWHTYRTDQVPFTTGLRFPIADVPLIQAILETHKSMIVGDTENNPYWLQLPVMTGIRSALCIPIFSGEQVYGILQLLKTTPYFYTAEMAKRLANFAIYASIAIKNAHLYEQSQVLAVLEERQRLARELHDSVTQMLYSANNIAHSVLRFMDKKPEKAREYLVQLAQVTQGAMAEMRSLLFELRPDAVTQNDLATVLELLCQTFTGKTGVQVDLDTQTGLTLVPDKQMVFYRTAQEALNNIVKHANATRVRLTLRLYDEEVELTIEDNGIGFDPQHLPPGHFGVKFMQERAMKIEASLFIISQPRQGTKIILRK